MNYRKFRKNAKALSPVVASIILIAVTVAVSVVVAAWMGGMTIGLMGNAEQVSITNIAFLPQSTAPDELQVMVTNSGSATSSISTAFINGVQTSLGAVIYPAPTPSPLPTNPTLTKTTTITITLALPNNGVLSPGSSYQVKLVTAKGTSVVNTATYNP